MNNQVHDSPQSGRDAVVKLFTELYTALDETPRTHTKVEALVAYLRAAPPEDAIWAISLLMGRKLRHAVPAHKLRRWAAEEGGIAEWLFDAAYEVVGDLAETITLVLPPGTYDDNRRLKVWVEQHLIPLRGISEERQRETVTSAWRGMNRSQRLVWNKLMTGALRVGVSQRIMTRALAQFSGIEEAAIAHRLMGTWEPDPGFWERLFSSQTADADLCRPYPFFLAYPLATAPEELGAPEEWQAEWKWDGIRAQVVRRGHQTFVWSRGQELVTEKFPEIRDAAQQLPNGSVLDGEILAWKDGRPLNFADLQQRIGRKNLGSRVRSSVPVVLVAYDLLELNGVDVRPRELAWRAAALGELLSRLGDPRLRHSARLGPADWRDLARFREESRLRGVEGLMLKRLGSPYGIGRRRGDWWKWKINPLSVDAVLTYARRGHGKRSGLYTDYTFSVWDGDRLVPFAKAFSGLTAAQIRQVDRFIRGHTLERFGPVCSVKPELVFEIAFEGIRRSARHRSGVAVRFPRVARWRTDKTIAEADRLETVTGLIFGGTPSKNADVG